MSKRSSNFTSIVLAMSLLVGAFSFGFSAPASAMSSEKSGAISQHCGSIKQSLKALQKTDARSRSYLGSVYETIITKFITPMNMRLVESGRLNSNLTDLQSTIVDVRKNFVSAYTSYSQEFEELLLMDCQSNPNAFYEQLNDTRQKRAEVSSITTNLRNLFSEYLTGVRKVRNSLTEGTQDE